MPRTLNHSKVMSESDGEEIHSIILGHKQTAELKIEERNKSLALDKLESFRALKTVMLNNVAWVIAGPPVMKSELRKVENSKRRRRIFVITVRIERHYAPNS